MAGTRGPDVTPFAGMSVFHVAATMTIEQDDDPTGPVTTVTMSAIIHARNAATARALYRAELEPIRAGHPMTCHAEPVRPAGPMVQPPGPA